MTREELIKQCRYYTGGEYHDFPGDGGMFWACERNWVERNGGAPEHFYSDYEGIGGKRHPEVPYALLITIFNLWGKCCVVPMEEDLPVFYKLIDDCYLKKPKNG